LGDRLLHVREVSAGTVRVALASSPGTTPEEDDGEPFSLPALPVDIAVDRVALGDFLLEQDGQPLPVTLGNLEATFAAGRQGAQLRIASLRVGHEVGQADISGQAELQGMADPWPFAARLDVIARGTGSDSPLCEADKLSSVFEQAQGAGRKPDPKAGAGKRDPKAAEAKAADAASALPSEAPRPACQVVLRADAAGSLDGIQAKLDGEGSGLLLDVTADLAPRTALVLRSARARAQLPDQSTLAAQLDLQPDTAQAAGRERIAGTISAQRLDLSPWLGKDIPPAVLTVRGDVRADIENLSQLRHAAVDLRFEEGTRWNRQPLSGALKAQVDIAAAGDEPASPDADPLAGLRIHGLDVDLKLGRNQIQAAGELDARDGALSLDAKAPQLDAFWPGIPGGAELKGKLTGTLAAHRGELAAGYTPAKPRPGVLGEAPAKANIAFAGAWGKGPAGTPDAALPGWRGTFSRLTAETAGFT
ncbi:MAG: hypothetical protein OJK14_13390, partial [Achromobacter sp.]|nr:hypothetical protein [Achromobacter sp.]